MTPPRDLYRTDWNTLRDIHYCKRHDKRPNCLRVNLVGPAKTTGTCFSLENVDFGKQYRRAVDRRADFHEIDCPQERARMYETADNFLDHSGLKLEVVVVMYTVAVPRGEVPL